MSDRPVEPMDGFETRFVRLLERASDPALRHVDPAAVAHEVALQRRGRTWLGMTSRRALLVSSVTILGLLLVVVLVALIGQARHQDPLGSPWATIREVAWSPDGSKLAFFVFDDRSTDAPDASAASPRATSDPSTEAVKDLYVVNADGSGLHRVASTQPAGLDWTAPSWSADGRFLAYAGVPDIDPTTGFGPTHAYTVPADGGDPTDLGLLDGDTWPVRWSPVGDRLVGVKWDDVGADIVAINADGSGRQVLTSDHRSNDPSWSPDGSRIFFQVGLPAANGGDDVITPALMDPDGSDRVSLDMCAYALPEWAPDGRSLFCSGADGGQRRVSLDGRSSAPDPLPLPGHARRSPDGTMAVDWQEEQPTGVHVLHEDGSMTRLTTDPNDQYPTWSPTSRWVAFWGTRPSGTGLFAVPADGGNAVLVGSNAALQPRTIVAWRPAAAGAPRLAYIRDRSIVTVGVDGADPRVVVGDASIAAPRGSPLPSNGVADHVVIDADGPDRAAYRLPAGPDAVLTIENRSDSLWVVELIDDSGPGKQDCHRMAGVSIQLAALRVAPQPPGITAQMVPPVCDVPPHSTVRLTDAGFVPVGSLEAWFRRGSHGPSHVVLIEFASSDRP